MDERVMSSGCRPKLSATSLHCRRPALEVDHVPSARSDAIVRMYMSGKRRSLALGTDGEHDPRADASAGDDAATLDRVGAIDGAAAGTDPATLAAARPRFAHRSRSGRRSGAPRAPPASRSPRLLGGVLVPRRASGAPGARPTRSPARTGCRDSRPC